MFLIFANNVTPQTLDFLISKRRKLKIRFSNKVMLNAWFCSQKQQQQKENFYRINIYYKLEKKD